MLKKTLKIKPEERTSLVEFLVTKRVKYLEYLRDIHSDEGGLWMNTVFVNRPYLGRYFGVPGDCLTTGSGVEADGETAGLARVPLDMSHTTETSAAEESEEAYLYVPLDKLPNPASVGRDSSIGEWHKRYLPGFVALAMALSDLLLVPMAGEEFLESFYHLLLEAEVAVSGGIAAKTLAQRNLKTLRLRSSAALAAALSAASGDGGGDGGADPGNAPETPLRSAASPTPGLTNPSTASAAANTTSSEQFKHIFLQSQHLSYTAGTPGYDMVLPALFSALIFAYRRLCDYDLTNREDCVKRILSIDKHVEKLVLGRVGKELERAARLKLVREAYLLSPRGLFSEVAGGEADADFINDILVATQASAQAKAGAGAAQREGDDEPSSSELEDALEG